MVHVLTLEMGGTGFWSGMLGQVSRLRVVHLLPAIFIYPFKGGRLRSFIRSLFALPGFLFQKGFNQVHHLIAHLPLEMPCIFAVERAGLHFQYFNLFAIHHYRNAHRFASPEGAQQPRTACLVVLNRCDFLDGPSATTTS